MSGAFILESWVEAQGDLPVRIGIVMTGRSYHTAEQLPDALELADESSLDDALAQVNRLLGEENALPASCLIAVSGQHCGTVGSHEPRALNDGEELTLIAPVAGG
jgi:hypothetical protein